MSRLLLFDIDCTLIDTGGAGMAALKEAARELFGADGPELDLAGSTDSGIVMGMLEHFQSDLSHDAFYQVYLAKLGPNLAAFKGRVLPGVEELLSDLEEREAPLGLLTGNIVGGAKAKIDHYGLAGYFPMDVGAYGDDHHDRNRLGPVALARASAEYDRTFHAENTVVIGDTPKDIACGKAMGAMTLAVATGGFSVDDLAAYGADVVVTDLTCPEVREILVQ
ncbi:MAG: HAD hydrolase-like protein [Verrucomicrobiae bacterium]|nr:HAD hydrolase-like protein [Verrucomicrobiae bacterium]NNJ43490.1 HAD hydrolase-like protein [Akkermansiaceae bacterium]